MIEHIKNLIDSLKHICHSEHGSDYARQNHIKLTIAFQQLSLELDEAMYAGAIEICQSCERIVATSEICGESCEACSYDVCRECAGTGQGNDVLSSKAGICHSCGGSGLQRVINVD